MARKSKNAQAQTTSADNGAQATATEEQGSAARSAPKGRTPGGQFAAGNPGGPGNPHARACARMLQVFRDNITEDEMLQICRMLFVKAVGGDVSAAKIILSYKIGRPLPAPHPDTIDRDEWNHYQQDAMDLTEMKTVLTGLPTRVGNDIARVSLPIMTAARTNELALKLREGLEEKPSEAPPEPPASQAETSEQVETKSDGSGAKNQPISNGKSGDKNQPISNGKSGTKNQPLANGKLDERARPPSVKKAPIPRRFSGMRTRLKKK